MKIQLHWDNIYSTKDFTNCSWYQPIPIEGIALIEKLNLSKDANIIDIGGGDSYFVDYLIDNGYTNITVLDISAIAIDKAKSRLGTKANLVNWIVADITAVNLDAKYDFWHDRAVFHFLTDESSVQSYLNLIQNHLSNTAHVLIGTFSDEGPLKCSGLTIQQYTIKSLSHLFTPFLKVQNCYKREHLTPNGSEQHFVFCVFSNIE